MPLTTLSSLFLRTPLFSCAGYSPVLDSRVLGDPLFQTAIFLASPAFYRVLESRKFDASSLSEKELLSLKKYHNRMSFRPTPFGLFSSFTMTEWGPGSPLTLDDPGAATVHIRPDQELATLLARTLNLSLPADTFRLNPTLYPLGGEFRFIKTAPAENEPGLACSLESLERNPLTKALCRFLAPAPKTGQEITCFLDEKTHCGEAEARSYLEFLKEAQVIVSTFSPNITGADYLQRLAALPGIPPAPLAALCGQFSPMAGRSVNTGRFHQLEQQAKNVLAGYALPAPAKFFYVNTERKTGPGSLSNHYLEKIAAAVGALQKLVPQGTLPLLAEFTRNFKERFDRARIPLLQAMDPDAGVGYGQFAGRPVVPRLLKDIQFPGKPGEPGVIEWSGIHRVLLAKWNQAGPGGPVRLQAGDLQDLRELSPQPVPPSISVLFRITGEGILIESAGGATATALTGRFTPFSQEAWQTGREIAALEKEVNPGVIFAEIAHRSGLHTDNINRRQTVYEHEIPVNSISLLPEDRQLPLHDLAVSVRGGEVILESLRLNKRVIPRLSSAYNFRHNHLAVFRFLCDLQHQGLGSNLSFVPENYFPGMAAYPRVEYEGVILSPAKWYVNAEQAKMPPAQLRATLQLPPRIALTSHDQQLVFDLDDEEQSRFFADCTRGLPGFTLQEFFLPGGADNPVVSRDGRPYINQLVAFLVNRERVYQPLPAETPLSKKIKRTFITGSTWLYLKIYCTPQMADDLLVRRVLPVIRDVLKEQPASWFFIRYQDPGPHIRLRISIPEARTGEVISRFKKQFAGLAGNQMIRQYQADTYRRELERYGGALITAAEDLFRASSDLVIYFLKNNRQRDSDPDRLAIATFNLLLARWLPGLPDQTSFLEKVSGSFYTEFNGDKTFRVELDKLYRSHRQEFSRSVSDTRIYREFRLTKQFRAFDHAIRAVLKKAGGFDEQRKTTLLADLIHMHLNRLYSDRQRQQEMVLYYCFYKYKVSQLAIHQDSVAGLPPALEQIFFHGIQ